MSSIKYVSSNGKEYDLIGAQMRATNGSFHQYGWSENATQKSKGSAVYGFDRESVTYKLTLTLRGSLYSRKERLNDLTNSFEYDVVNLTPGRFWYGEYYIDGFVKAASNEISDVFNNWTNVIADIYCPYPFWIWEQEKKFFPESRGKGEAYAYLDYDYDYPYDYSRPQSGTQNWKIDHFTASNFKMTIYGPCTNPRITINGHVYQVYETLENDEHMIIESTGKTIKKYLSNGTVQNIFAKRRKDSSVFELLPHGELLISWNAEFGFDIVAYRERSVPEWILSGQM